MEPKKRIVLMAWLLPIAGWSLFAVSGQAFGLQLPDELLARVTRALLVYLLFAGFATWGVYNSRARRAVRVFFQSKDRTLNLAIARIVIFFYIFKTSGSWRKKLEKALVMPDELIMPVQVWGDLLLSLWPSADSLRLLHTALVVASFLAMIGLFSRASAWAVVVTGFFVYGTPQFFGKVNHFHHLLWFSAILAASPCGATLSVDAMIRAWHRGARTFTERRASRAAALALRFAWLQLGILYFFPGFWKIVHGGTAWFLSENLKFRMYAKWLQVDYVPAWRIDLYPILYKSAALATIAFELLFIVAVFFPKGRILAGVGGLLFHNSTKYFMRIGFGSLQVCYVLIFDWSAVLRRLGRTLFRQQLEVTYRGGSPLLARLLAMARELDIMERIRFRREEKISDTSRLAWADSLEVRSGQKVLGGLSGLTALISRLPMLWPLLPPVWLAQEAWPPSPTHSRSGVHKTGMHKTVTHSVMPVMLTGTILLTCNILFGITFTTSSWPFANYPAFAGVFKKSIRSSISLQGLTETADPTQVYSLRSLHDVGGKVRITRMGNRIASSKLDRESRERLAHGAWRLLVEKYPELATATRLRVFRDKLSSVPEDWDSNPIQQRLLFEIALEKGGDKIEAQRR